ncbi:MAG: hypothetical protein ACXVO9_05210 [Bacteroidia bacterium]
MEKQLKINEFEQFFSDKALKKGLSILKNDELQLVGKPAKGEYHFMIKNSSLRVKRKAETIISYHCSCGKENCEHLCAVIFYFQKEVFENLISGKNYDRKQTDLFKSYCQKVKEIIFLKSGVLKNPDEVSKSLNSLLRSKAHNYFICLAVMNELTSLPTINTEDKKKLDDLINIVKSRFHRLAKKKPGAEEVNALFRATLNSVSSSRRFNTGLFSFLIPYATLYTRDKNALRELKESIEKRAIKYPYPGALDAKLIAVFHIENAGKDLNHKKKKRNDFQNVPEFYIAQAEQALCSDKNLKALKILRNGFENLKQNKPANFIGYLEYIIEQALKTGDNEAEIFFIKQAFIHEYQVNPIYIKRLKTLLEKKEEHEFYNTVIEEIKKSHHDTFDKLSILLFARERYEELIKEINRRPDKFRLLNEVAIKMLPEYNDSLFKIYIKQFQNAVSLASEPYYQQKIFNDARRYLDKLPENEKGKLIKMIASGLGGASYLRKLISKTYSI